MQRETDMSAHHKRVIDQLNAKRAQRERILLNRRPVPEHSIHRHSVGVLFFFTFLFHLRGQPLQVINI